MKVILPIADDPLLNQLPSYAHPLSILLLDRERNLPYLLNDFVLPAAKKENGVLCNAAYDWMYIGCGALSYECGVFPQSILEEPPALLDFLLAMLRRGRYCLMDLDEFHCRFSGRYQREHAAGGFLINGMDTEQGRIYLCGYSQNGLYTQNAVSLEEFAQALGGSSADLAVHCLREKPGSPAPVFNTAAFFRQAGAYADPDGVKGLPEGYVYGFSAISAFIDQIVEAKRRRGALSWHSVSTLREHKALMAARLSYLAERGVLEPEFPARYREIRRLTDDLYALALAYRDEARQPVNEFYSLAVNSQGAQERFLLEKMEAKAVRLRNAERDFFAELGRAGIREEIKNG